MTSSKNNINPAPPRGWVNRRELLRGSCGTAAAMLLSQAALKAEEVPKTQRPNILWD